MAWALIFEEDPVAWAAAEVPSGCCRLAMVVVLRGCDELNTTVFDHPKAADYENCAVQDSRVVCERSVNYRFCSVA